MVTQTKIKTDKNLINIKRAYEIKYRLKLAGLTQRDIKKALNISDAAVYRAIFGLSKISRVDIWLKENLGV